MKSLLHVVIVAIAIACGVVEMPAQVSIRNKPRVVPGEVIVKYKSDTPQTMVISSLASAGVVNIQSSPNLPFLVGKVASGKKLEEVLRVCQAQSNVEYAEPNYRVYALEMLQIPPVIPNDPRFNELWNLHQADDKDIDAPEAWAITTGSRDIIVGIIDTGIGYDHEDLKDNIWQNPDESGDKANNRIDDDGNGYVDDFRGWNFVFKNKDPYDDQGHGTHVAGTVGAVGNNGKGVVGVNWQVKLMAVKFLDSRGEGTTADTAKPYPVSTAVIDDASLTSVRLIYKLNGTVADSLQMAADADDAYIADIPGQPVNTTIEYAVTATDGDGNRAISPTFAFKITSEADPRDKAGCCGQCAVAIDGLDRSIRLAVQIPINVAFFLLPIVLLRRSKAKRR